MLTILIVLFATGLFFSSSKITLKQEKKTTVEPKYPPKQSFLKSQQEGIVKVVNISSDHINPSTLILKAGEIVQVINSTNESLQVKINILGGVILTVPGGKSSYLTNFNTKGVYEMEIADKPEIKGKITVE